MSKHGAVRDLAEWALIIPILKSLEHLPLAAAEYESQKLTQVLYAAAPRLARVARRNLSMALPQLSETQREKILEGVYRTLGRSLLCFARFPKLNSSNVSEWIRYEGFEHFQQALAQGRGVLFMTAHLGNWELSALAHAFFGNPMHILVRPLDNPLLDTLVTGYRTLSGNRIIQKTESPRRILEALAANEAVGVLIDQNTSADNGVFVNFFGLKACASVGLTKIALRTRAPVVPGFALWEPKEDRYVLRFWPPVEMTPTGDSEADIQTNTQRLHAMLEQIIRCYPDQWLWIHRRWKTRPPGEPPLY